MKTHPENIAEGNWAYWVINALEFANLKQIVRPVGKPYGLKMI